MKCLIFLCLLASSWSPAFAQEAKNATTTSTSTPSSSSSSSTPESSTTTTIAPPTTTTAKAADSVPAVKLVALNETETKSVGEKSALAYKVDEKDVTAGKPATTSTTAKSADPASSSSSEESSESAESSGPSRTKRQHQGDFTTGMRVDGDFNSASAGSLGQAAFDIADDGPNFRRRRSLKLDLSKYISIGWGPPKKIPTRVIVEKVHVPVPVHVTVPEIHEVHHVHYVQAPTTTTPPPPPPRQTALLTDTQRRFDRINRDLNTASRLIQNQRVQNDPVLARSIIIRAQGVTCQDVCSNGAIYGLLGICTNSYCTCEAGQNFEHLESECPGNRIFDPVRRACTDPRQSALCGDRPRNVYGPPNNQYGPPANQYGPPTSAPVTTNGPPATSSSLPPSTSYGLPTAPSAAFNLNYNQNQNLNQNYGLPSQQPALSTSYQVPPTTSSFYEGQSSYSPSNQYGQPAVTSGYQTPTNSPPAPAPSSGSGYQDTYLFANTPATGSGSSYRQTAAVLASSSSSSSTNNNNAGWGGQNGVDAGYSSYASNYPSSSYSSGSSSSYSAPSSSSSSSYAAPASSYSNIPSSSSSGSSSGSSSSYSVPSDGWDTGSPNAGGRDEVLSGFYDPSQFTNTNEYGQSSPQSSYGSSSSSSSSSSSYSNPNSYSTFK